MAETFIWRVYSQLPRVEYANAERRAAFGDGYSQGVGDGINNERQTWDLELWGHREHDDMGAAKAFLRDHRRRVASFNWTPPDEPEGLYRCIELSVVDELEGFIRITCKFEQSFQP